MAEPLVIDVQWAADMLASLVVHEGLAEWTNEMTGAASYVLTAYRNATAGVVRRLATGWHAHQEPVQGAWWWSRPGEPLAVRMTPAEVAVYEAAFDA